MIALNVILSLIMQSKRKGKGMLSNGKIYSALMLCISDHKSESDLLICFNNEVVPKEAYRKMDRFLSRFLKDGKGYPYELMRFTELEQSMDDPEKMAVYLQKIERILDGFIDPGKLGSLVYSLLKFLSQDREIKQIMYGNCYIDKERLLGRFVHQKRICVEALLLGLLYQSHKTPSTAKGIELIKRPDRSAFQVIRFSDDAPFELDLTLDIIGNIRNSSRNQETGHCEYPLEFICRGIETTVLPQYDDLFISGIRGSGKTVLMKSLINSDDTIFLYLSLEGYRKEYCSSFSHDPCWILLDILLKYHYQQEYSTYDTLAANVGEDVVIKQLSLLNEDFEMEPVYNKNWTLLIDGLNELPLELYNTFMQELGHICGFWKNVRVIITGRVFSEYKVFEGFEQVKLLGINDEILNGLLSDETHDAEINSLLKTPLLYKIYASAKGRAKTAGELLDLYFSQWPGSDVIRFLIRFALPLVAKKMLDDLEPCELSRAGVLQTIDHALNIYIFDDLVYQDHVKVQNIDKKSLLESRRDDDWIELLIKDTGLLKACEDDSSILRFTEQYYRDYFAARHIVNAVEIFENGSVGQDNAEKYLAEIGLSGLWFNEPEHFPEKFDTYRMLGDVCRERLKGPGNDEFYIPNTLDRFLDICRGLKGGYSAENVIIVKKLIHNNMICHTDFSYIDLPLLLPGDVSFSLDGEYPCDFCNSRVYRVAESDDEKQTFRNCDFEEAVFLDMEIKDKIHHLGGIVDFEDNRFMDENFRELVLPWIEPLPKSRYSDAAKEYL